MLVNARSDSTWTAGRSCKFSQVKSKGIQFFSCAVNSNSLFWGNNCTVLQSTIAELVFCGKQDKTNTIDDAKMSKWCPTGGKKLLHWPIRVRLLYIHIQTRILYCRRLLTCRSLRAVANWRSAIASSDNGGPSFLLLLWFSDVDRKWSSSVASRSAPSLISESRVLPDELFFPYEDPADPGSRFDL